jgi:hypothetical protein
VYQVGIAYYEMKECFNVYRFHVVGSDVKGKMDCIMTTMMIIELKICIY